MNVPVVTFSKENDTKLLENKNQVLNKLLNGINIDHKWLFNIKITTWFI